MNINKNINYLDAVANSFDGDGHIFINCNFKSTTMEGAQFADAVFVGCSFENTDFYWASFFRARFINCKLKNIDFRGASLEDCCFISSELLDCDFGTDNLGGATDVSLLFLIDSTANNCKGLNNAQQ